MKTTEYIDLLKQRKHLKSNYAVAKYLGLSPSSLTNYSSGKTHFSDEIALRFADELGIDKRVILADIHAERENNPEIKKLWEQIASQLKSVAACCFLVVMSALPMDDTQAAVQNGQNARSFDVLPSYILCELRKRLKRAVAWLVAGLMRPAFC